MGMAASDPNQTRARKARMQIRRQRDQLAGKEAALARPSDANQFILAQSGRTFLCAHHRAQDQARHLSQCGCITLRNHFLHRTSQRPPNTVPMDKISRRHPQLNRTLLCLQFANQGLKCHELLVQDTGAGSVCEVLARLRALLGWKMVRVVSWFTTCRLQRSYVVISFISLTEGGQPWEAPN